MKAHNITSSLATLVVLLLAGPALAKDAAPTNLPSPAALATTVRETLPDVWPACVAIRIKGNASGVVISPDGWVLTAGHVLMKKPVDTEATIILPDGTEAKAGDALVEGPRDPKELIEIKGVRETQRYLVEEVQKQVRVPLLRIDDAMAQKAIEMGRKIIR